MGYNIPADHHGSLPKVEKCNLSRVEVGIKVLSVESRLEHTGSISHVCVLEKGHVNRERDPIEYCRCVCDHQWRKFHSE